MFGRGFARQVIAPAADGQPAFVASGVHWASDLIAAHPVSWDLLFALTQLAIGVGLLLRSTVLVRAALAASVAWAVGVWYFGEGLGGLASGRFDLDGRAGRGPAVRGVGRGGLARAGSREGQPTSAMAGRAVGPVVVRGGPVGGAPGAGWRRRPDR
jgi:hypothetical protein